MIQQYDAIHSASVLYCKLALTDLCLATLQEKAYTQHTCNSERHSGSFLYLTSFHGSELVSLASPIDL